MLNYQRVSPVNISHFDIPGNIPVGDFSPTSQLTTISTRPTGSKKCGKNTPWIVHTKAENPW